MKRLTLCAVLILALLTLPGCSHSSGSASSEPSAVPTDLHTQTETAPTLSAEEQILSRMTLREKVGQLFIVTPDALTADGSSPTALLDDMAENLIHYPVGGIIHFSENMVSPEQIREFNRDLQQASSVALFLCVDEEGNVVTGDHILYLLGCYMKKREQLEGNTVVTTVMSNLGLYKAFDKAGIQYAQTQVGDKYVYEYMAEHGCRLGGEQSGHIIVSKYATTGDGILTSLKVMEVMLSEKKRLSELAKGVKMYPQILKNIRVADKAAARQDPEVMAAVDRAAAELGDNGRILVRESGTEPVIRIMVEAANKAICQQHVDAVAEVLFTRGHGRS